jgi:hypothetical protein
MWRYVYDPIIIQKSTCWIPILYVFCHQTKPNIDCVQLRYFSFMCYKRIILIDVAYITFSCTHYVWQIIVMAKVIDLDILIDLHVLTPPPPPPNARKLVYHLPVCMCVCMCCPLALERLDRCFSYLVFRHLSSIGRYPTKWTFQLQKKAFFLDWPQITTFSHMQVPWFWFNFGNLWRPYP